MAEGVAEACRGTARRARAASSGRRRAIADAHASNPAGAGQSARMNRHHLEQLAHLLLVAQPLDAPLAISSTALGIGAGERRGPGADAEPLEPFALRRPPASPSRRASAAARAERFEIDVGGQVLLAGIDEHGAKRWPRTACSVSPGARSGVAVVDDQRDAAALAELARDRRRPPRRAPANPRRSRRRGRTPARRRRSVTFRSIAADELPDRKRVEEFVGDQQQAAASGKSSMLVMPIGVRHALRLLSRRKHRAGLDQMHFAREARPAAAPAAHRRRASRARAQARHRPHPPAPRPESSIGQRGADHLAEHLADFRRGGEVAVRARAGRASRNNSALQASI